MNEWLALRRVHEGGVTTLGGRFFNHGRSIAEYLAVAVDELIRAELLALGRADPAGVAQVCLTRAGQLRYAELNANGARGNRHEG